MCGWLQFSSHILRLTPFTVWLATVLLPHTETYTIHIVAGYSSRLTYRDLHHLQCGWLQFSSHIPRPTSFTVWLATVLVQHTKTYMIQCVAGYSSRRTYLGLHHSQCGWLQFSSNILRLTPFTVDTVLNPHTKMYTIHGVVGYSSWPIYQDLHHSQWIQFSTHIQRLTPFTVWLATVLDPHTKTYIIQSVVGYSSRSIYWNLHHSQCGWLQSWKVRFPHMRITRCIIWLTTVLIPNTRSTQYVHYYNIAIFYSCGSWICENLKSASQPYLTIQKLLLGVCTQTCTNLVILETESGSAKSFIKK